MDGRTRITVVLCTFNRARSLARALESVAAQSLPESIGWEILVVDNNSSDETRAVVEDFQRRYPERIRYLFEPQPGLSYARNAGVRDARGDVLAFTDDDVTVDPRWLQNLTAQLHDGEWAGAGGRVLAEWTCPPPRWLRLESPYLSAPFVAFDRGPEAGPLNDAPFGANMAFRKAVFERYGGFRTDLGRRPGSMIGGEEAEFGRRLLDAGQRLHYEPSAVVNHPVEENRMQKKYVLDWSFGDGIGWVRMNGIRPGTRYCVSGIPLYMFRNLARWTLQWVFAVEPSRRFEYKRYVWIKLGEISETYRQSHSAKTE
jgi:glycosyltransferase involved in cell wall biosynthesis